MEKKVVLGLQVAHHLRNGGLTMVNIGSTKSEIRKNLRDGDLIILLYYGMHHAGIYYHGLLYNSHGKIGPEATNNIDSYYFSDDPKYNNAGSKKSISMPTVYRNNKNNKMKKVFLFAIILLLFFTKSVCLSQGFVKKETIIPLDNIKGVPFAKDNELNDLIVDGFEIDKNGSFYFTGGSKVVYLAAFSGQKMLYRTTMKELSHGSLLYFYDNNLYTFNRANKNLIMINSSNGLLLKSNKIKVESTSYTFTNSGILFQSLDGSGNFIYSQYDFMGNYIKQLANEYGLAAQIIPKGVDVSACELVGKWNENFVFWSIQKGNTYSEKLWLVDKEGKVLSSKILPKGLGGDGYAGNPSEGRKVRNGRFYVLGRNGFKAVITEISLVNFFDK